MEATDETFGSTGLLSLARTEQGKNLRLQRLMVAQLHAQDVLIFYSQDICRQVCIQAKALLFIVHGLFVC